jgi:hypothetical protein
VIHSTALRNAQANALTTLADAGTGGAGSAILELRTGATIGSGTLLASITMAHPSFGSASTGVITGASFPRSDTSADNTGTIGHYLLKDSDSNVVASGTNVGAGSGDLNMVTLSVVATQPVTINSFTYTIPAGTT